MKCLEKFWPLRTIPTILVTDFIYKKSTWNGEYIVVHNRDYGWCENLKRGIDGFKQFRAFLMLQEDFFLSESPDVEFIKFAVAKLLEDSNIGCFRLYPCPGSDVEIGEKRYGMVSKKAPYQVSCQAAIWNPAYMNKLLSLGPGPRDFEVLGTRYCSRTESVKTLAVKRDSPKPYPIEYICTAIVSGEWQKSALDHCKNLGIDVDTTMRPTT